MNPRSRDEVLQAMVDRFEANDWDGYVDLHADDVVIEMPLAPEGWPNKIEGIENWRSYIAKLGETISVNSFPKLIVHRSEDPDVLIAEVTVDGTVLATGDSYDVSYVWILVVRDGKIVRFHDYWSAAQASAAVQADK